jgi:transcriptional regulator with XRE-family HTH domain
VSAQSGTRELGEFLRTLRNRINPEEIGLPTYGERRRVAGLRREELAMLAGVSSSYYTRLEQGHSRNASPEVLDAIAGALQLGEAERQHLRDLATSSSRRPTSRRPPVEHVDPALSQLLASIPSVPAIVLGRRSDVLAWNRLGHALLAGGIDFSAVADPKRRPNMAEVVFLDPNSRELYADWLAKARAVVGNLRIVAGQFPDDPVLSSLVGTLSMASTQFAQMWAEHRIRPCASAVYEMHHSLVGALTLTQQTLRSVEHPEQTIVTCTAVPDSSSAEALVLLAHIVGGSETSGRETPFRDIR